MAKEWMFDREATETEKHIAENIEMEQKLLAEAVVMRDALQELFQEGRTYPGLLDDLELLNETIDLKEKMDKEFDLDRKRDLEQQFVEHLVIAKEIAASPDKRILRQPPL